MNDKLWDEACKFAANPYDVEIERDTLSDGQTVYLARNPELPGCKAQGMSEDEAKKNLDEARVDYIYALLEEGLPVPEAAPYQSVTGVMGGVEPTEPYMFSGRPASDVDEAAQPDDRERLFGMTLRGDLIKRQ